MRFLGRSCFWACSPRALPVLKKRSSNVEPQTRLAAAPRLREPRGRPAALLICTDPQMSAEDLMHYYLWRWGMEVNFRDEKAWREPGRRKCARNSPTKTSRHAPWRRTCFYGWPRSRLGTASLSGCPGRSGARTSPRGRRARSICSGLCAASNGTLKSAGRFSPTSWQSAPRSRAQRNSKPVFPTSCSSLRNHPSCASLPPALRCQTPVRLFIRQVICQSRLPCPRACPMCAVLECCVCQT